MTDEPQTGVGVERVCVCVCVSVCVCDRVRKSSELMFLPGERAQHLGGNQLYL